jgi:glutathione peroxidase
MKKFTARSFFILSPLVSLCILLFLLPIKTTAADTTVQSCPELLNFNFKRLQDDVPQNLCQYSGKVVLVVNTASYCGYTGQYDGLEKLYANSLLSR